MHAKDCGYLATFHCITSAPLPPRKCSKAQTKMKPVSPIVLPSFFFEKLELGYFRAFPEVPSFKSSGIGRAGEIKAIPQKQRKQC